MRVLFIGNSYTYYHRMPELVAALAASGTPGARLVCESVTEGGMTLEWHAHNDETLRAIRQGGWDAVVMQEQSTRPVRMRDRMLKFGQFLAQEAESIGAQPFLYATWAREHIPEMIEPLSLSYAACAELIDAQVAPVGRAFAAVCERVPEIGLYADDHSHPSLAGSYLAACVFYAALLGANPVGLPREITLADQEPMVLDVAEARLLQEIAWAHVAPRPDV